MGNERAERLIRKYLDGTATPEEMALLESWYIAAAQDQPEMPGISDPQRIGEEILQRIRAEQQARLDQPQLKPPVRLWPRIAAAAAVLLIIIVGGTLFIRKNPPPPIVQNQPLQNDVLPATATATLTLLDGRTIPLDSTGSHTLPKQGDVSISSLDGQLIYNSHQQTLQLGAPLNNTLTTRPGQHYSLVLPDGTKVWLNAASSITYPLAFSGTERTVKVSGELYFEIVHNPKKPFRIATKDQLVEDIGTSLNISAYDSESIKTTLLEGSIKLTKGKTYKILKPGQQATTKPGDVDVQIKNVDPAGSIAWKKGFFYFDHADIKTVMRELARWYDVQVVYKGDLPKGAFKGKVYRNIKASEALGILSYFGAHFQIEGKTITVTS